MKRMGWVDQMRDLKSIDKVHVLSGDGWRGSDGIRWEILYQLTKFTYLLETYEEDGMRDLHSADQIVHVLSGQVIWRYFGTPQHYGPSACPKPWWFHLRNEISSHIADWNFSATGSSRSIIPTTGATPRLPSHRGVFCNSVDKCFSEHDPFPCLVPGAPPRPCS